MKSKDLILVIAGVLLMLVLVQGVQAAGIIVRNDLR